MSILLNIDSSNGIPSGETTHDFTVLYPSPIVLNGEWEIALIKANLWYSWYNISAAKQNNTVRYFNGLVFQPDIIIPDGQYTISQLNTYIQSVMKLNGDFTVNGSGQDVFDIILEANLSTIRTNLTLTSGYQLDLSFGNLYLLLGGTQTLQTISGDFPFVANINDSINTILIRTSLVSGRAVYNNGSNADIMFSFVPNSIPGSNIDISPINKIYLPVNSNSVSHDIYNARCYITDNLNRPIDLNGEPATYLYHLRLRTPPKV